MDLMLSASSQHKMKLISLSEGTTRVETAGLLELNSRQLSLHSTTITPERLEDALQTTNTQSTDVTTASDIGQLMSSVPAGELISEPKTSPKPSANSSVATHTSTYTMPSIP